MSSSSKSSGSEGPAAMDERKRKRMESNRESARRSRQKKQQHLDDLIRQVTQLQSQNGEFSSKLAKISERFGAVVATNAVLKAEKERLARRLASLESVIDTAAVVKGGNNIDHGATTVGRIRESINGSSSSTEFGGRGFSNAGSCESEMVKPWRQMMMIPDPAASSGGMFPS